MKLWIARDKNNTLGIYDAKPELYCDDWGCEEWVVRGHYSQHIYLNNELFPEVTFENSPQMVEVKLVLDYD